ncbi:MAG: DUF4390 domain-containing protein [Janthinobacterium lividum]
MARKPSARRVIEGMAVLARRPGTLPLWQALPARPFVALLATVLMVFMLALVPRSAQAADAVDILQAHLESSEEGYKLSATFALQLNPGLEDAIARGIPLYFTTEVEITRPRWYWFDEKAINETQTVRISYNLLTRQYRAVVGGSLQQNFNSLEDVLTMIRRPSRWVVAPKGALKPGQTYNVAVHMGLDVAQLPKPFQVHAMNSSDWRLSSEWKNFLFQAEGK